MYKQKNKKEISLVFVLFIKYSWKTQSQHQQQIFLDIFWVFFNCLSMVSLFSTNIVSNFNLMFNGSIVSSLYSLSFFTFSSQSSQLKGTLRKRVTTRNIRAQCYKTFYVRNLQVFVISNNGCPWKTFPAWSIVFMVRPGANPRVDHLKAASLR